MRSQAVDSIEICVRSGRKGPLCVEPGGAGLACADGIGQHQGVLAGNTFEELIDAFLFHQARQEVGLRWIVNRPLPNPKTASVGGQVHRRGPLGKESAFELPIL